MNLPNKLTLMRIILVPFFMLFLYWEIPYHFTIALIIFAAASITDALDGKIARKYNLITTFGKFADPLADKILVLAAFACLADIMQGQIVNGVVVTIIAA
ncbi:MAG: CDP-alcohol phosphatidyltransferase family protein, partial [Oscillospiraceae bacterium]|nr:CDP-alcohol phosphatidyltransferase family protein [Oscillospiraceae bacterium]